MTRPLLTELFRDRWLMVVSKPHGLPSQPARGGGDDLYTLLAAREPYVGLHHRLDQPASGCVLVALDPAVNKALAEAFRTHAIARTYVAVLAHAERLDVSTWPRHLPAPPPAREDQTSPPGVV